MAEIPIHFGLDIANELQMPVLYDRALEQPRIDRLMTEKLSAATQLSCLQEHRFRFFLVDIDRNTIPWVPKPLQKDIARVLGNKAVPSEKTLRNLKENRQLCLSNILTLDIALARYMGSVHSLFKKEVALSGLSSGLPDNCVVPSLNMLDITKLRHNGHSLWNYALTHMGIGKDEIAKHLEQHCGSLDAEQLVDEIHKRSLNGRIKRQPAEVRITRKSAQCIWNYLASRDRKGVLSKYNLSDMFEDRPMQGSGNGKWTESLLQLQGNII